MDPISMTYHCTAEGCHAAVAQFPLAVAMQARHLPNVEHDGRVYVPYTGTVLPPEKAATRGCAPGFYMEYRALHVSPPHP
jgi:hypothetical protein